MFSSSEVPHIFFDSSNVIINCFFTHMNCSEHVIQLTRNNSAKPGSVRGSDSPASTRAGSRAGPGLRVSRVRGHVSWLPVSLLEEAVCPLRLRRRGARHRGRGGLHQILCGPDIREVRMCDNPNVNTIYALGHLDPKRKSPGLCMDLSVILARIKRFRIGENHLGEEDIYSISFLFMTLTPSTVMT